MNPSFEELLKDMPKLELHIHLEGTFDLDTICMLAAKANEPLLRPKESLLQFDGLTDFLNLLDWICALVREKEDAKALAFRYAQYARTQGVCYSEVIINPSHWKNIDFSQLLCGVLEGFDEAENAGLPDCRLLVSLRREQDSESAVQVVDWVIKHPHHRLLGMSVDGNEALSVDSNLRFAPILQHAKDNGLHLTVHAGESSGPEGVRGALDVLHAERIDHGVRSVEDPELLQRLKDAHIALNVCFSSNVIGGLYSPQTHPLGKLFSDGQLVTVSTDDPMLLDLPLLKELQIVTEQYGWGINEVLQLQKNAVAAGFCTQEEKEKLYAYIDVFQKKLSAF